VLREVQKQGRYHFLTKSAQALYKKEKSASVFIFKQKLFYV